MPGKLRKLNNMAFGSVHKLAENITTHISPVRSSRQFNNMYVVSLRNSLFRVPVPSRDSRLPERKRIRLLRRLVCSRKFSILFGLITLTVSSEGLVD